MQAPSYQVALLKGDYIPSKISGACTAGQEGCHPNGVESTPTVAGLFGLPYQYSFSHGKTLTGDWSRAPSRMRFAISILPPRCSVRLHGEPWHHINGQHPFTLRYLQPEIVFSRVVMYTWGPTIIPRTVSTGMFSKDCPLTASKMSPMLTCPELHRKKKSVDVPGLQRMRMVANTGQRFWPAPIDA